jgi:predicted acylesterase/phospholipase RssA
MLTETEYDPKTLDEPIGIVLGGGGVLGDFQVGALKFLLKYLDDKGVKPKIICGTSVGAFNAAGIAAGIANRQGATQLESLWMHITSVKDLYEYEAMFKAMEPSLRALIHGKTIGRLDAIKDLGLLGLGFLRGNVARLDKLSKDLDKLGDLNLSLLHQKPIQDQFLRYIKRKDLKATLNSDITLCLASVNLEEGELTYFFNRADASGSTINQKVCTTLDSLINAIFASASVPGLFKPMEIDNKNYVDGSARETVALNAAIDYGACTIFVIPCFPLLMTTTPTYAFTDTKIPNYRCDSNLLDIAVRSLNVVLNEMIRNDLIPHCGWGGRLVIINPEETIHEMTDFDCGHIKINIDYGYMRAFDVIKGPSLNSADYERCRELSKEISSKRVEVWKKEEEFIREWVKARYQRPWRYHSPYKILADTRKIHIIRDLKRELAPLVTERINLATRESMPGNPEDMYRQWELHDWDPKYRILSKHPVIQNPWDRLDRLDLGSKDIEAETPPP